MTVESASYISQLDGLLPTMGDPKSEGDNHLRLIKTVLKTQFPNFGTAAMTATVAELNYSVGVTSAIQTQLNSKGAIAGQTWTGTHDFTGANITVPTATAGDNSTKPASTAYVDATAFASALPSQTGNAGKWITTNGTTASWTNEHATDVTYTGTARRIKGDLTNFTRANRLLFTDSAPNSFAVLGVVPSLPGGIGASFEAYASNDPDNSANTALFSNAFSGAAGLNSAKKGSGTTLPLSFCIDGSEAFKVDTSRNVLVTGGGGLGYGTGSGGAVTQLTSKSTSVTLNKICGTVTMNNASLAAGATVAFGINNSLVSRYDTVIVTGYNLHDWTQYSARTSVTDGVIYVFVKNESAGARAEPLVINFTIIKCVAS